MKGEHKLWESSRGRVGGPTRQRKQDISRPGDVCWGGQKGPCSGNMQGRMGRRERRKNQLGPGGVGVAGQEALIKQNFVPITNSGELHGDQIQPPDSTHLTHQSPNPGFGWGSLGWRVKGGHGAGLGSLSRSPDRPGGPQVWMERNPGQKVGPEEREPPPTLCSVALIAAEDYFRS